MKKIILSLCLILSFFVLGGCNKYTVSTFQPDQMNGSDCPNPIYVATMSRTGKVVATNSEFAGYVERIILDQNDFTLVSLLDFARKEHGKDVTIHNVRWDIKNGKKKTGVIFDVVKCK